MEGSRPDRSKRAPTFLAVDANVLDSVRVVDANIFSCHGPKVLLSVRGRLSAQTRS